MSGILGIWNRNGAPVSSSVLGAMAERIAHRGGDALECAISGPCALGCHLRRVTPESAFERQPLEDGNGNLLLFDGRLDNRSELIAALEWNGDAATLPDSQLLLMAWRHWGSRFTGKLLGDFALAIFQSREQKLLLARDPVGCRPLFYSIGDDFIAFASEAKALLAHPKIPAEPNLDLVADSILLDSPHFEDDEETFFAGIRRVLPGYRIVVKPDSIRASRFWDFTPSGRIRNKAYSDYVLSLRERLTRAIRRRSRSSYPVATSVSGGINSAVILRVAQQTCKNALPEVGVVPLSYSSPVSSAPFIHLLEDEFGIPVAQVEIGSAGEPQYLAEAAWYSEGPFFNDTWCAETPLLARARDEGARVLLTGRWGSHLMCGTAYLTDLWKSLAWRRLLRHLRGYSRWFADRESSDARGGFYRELMLHFAPGVVRSVLQLPFGKSASLNSNRAWATPDLIKRARRSRPPGRHPRWGSAHGRSIYRAVHAKFFRLAVEADEMMAARYGLEHCTPFLDREVISFLMAIPGDLQTREGIPGALMRDAVRGLVPSKIRKHSKVRDVSAIALREARLAAYRRAQLNGAANSSLTVVSRDLLSPSQRADALALESWLHAYFGSGMER